MSQQNDSGGDFLAAVRRLVVAGRTTGGTAGRDEGLCAALDAVEAFLAAQPHERNSVTQPSGVPSGGDAQGQDSAEGVKGPFPPRGPGTCICADPENCTYPVAGCRAMAAKASECHRGFNGLDTLATLKEYPNLAAIVSGTVAGSFCEWPAVRKELIDFLNAGKPFLRGRTETPVLCAVCGLPTPDDDRIAAYTRRYHRACLEFAASRPGNEKLSEFLGRRT